MTLTQLKLTFLTAVLGAFVCASNGSASAIAYNSFGPNDTYESYGNWQGSDFFGETKLSQRFTPQASGVLNKIELGFFFTPPELGGITEQNVDELTLALVPDVNEYPGTQVLWSQFYAGNSPTDFGSVANFDVIDGPTLEAGTKYWLISRSALVGYRPHSWYRAPSSDVPLPSPEPFAIANPQTAGGQWVRLTWPHDPGFALRVTVVPEPAAAALMIAASATLLAIRRRTVSF